MTWKRTKRDKLIDNKWLGVYSDTVEMPSGDVSEMMIVDLRDSVMVVPVKITDQGLRFILVKQYRYPLGREDYEFPGGACDKGESKEQAARRELLEETGYEAESIKFIYHMDKMASRSNSTEAIYLAVVGSQVGNQLDDMEKESGLSIVEVSDDELLKMVRDNAITDTHTIAALAVAMLQGPKAKEYIEQIVKE